jgi:hypothetical protein
VSASFYKPDDANLLVVEAYAAAGPLRERVQGAVSAPSGLSFSVVMVVWSSIQ